MRQSEHEKDASGREHALQNVPRPVRPESLIERSVQGSAHAILHQPEERWNPTRAYQV
jgi:hypothetical protein